MTYQEWLRHSRHHEAAGFELMVHLNRLWFAANVIHGHEPDPAIYGVWDPARGSGQPRKIRATSGAL